MKMLYHSALVFAMVDITPRSPYEMLITTVMIISAAFITAYIYGQFAQYTQELNERSSTLYT